MSEIFLLILLGFVALLWHSASTSKERAFAIAKRECAKQNLQLLDQTVVLDEARVRRDDTGWPTLWRRYRFDYTETGDARNEGLLLLNGTRLVRIDLGSEQTIIH
ncbi:MAG: DUF3301 domain-containing protein [Gammaproteobacteria bacterium]|jgi:hypothetical protein|nr:DUF3301 domain-containing protein [Gammaproteobacteria bacterium]